MTLYLLGLRGSGKSTIGPVVAASRHAAYVDLDHVTPGVLGVQTAAEALRQHGLPAFREAERKALDDPRVLAAGVVALGGGTPTHPPCEAELRVRAARGDVLIYLRASVETLRSRLRATNVATRPSLTGADPIAEVQTLWDRRDPLYRDLATRVIEMDGLTEADAAERVLRAVSQA